MISSNLMDRYKTEAVPALQKQFSYANPMQVPRLSKIVVNVGLGEPRRDRQRKLRPQIHPGKPAPQAIHSSQ